MSPNTSCRTGLMRRPVVDVGQVHGHLDDVLERAAGRREHDAHDLEHPPRLCDDVVTADQRSPRVDRHDAADEQEATGLDGVRVVRDRLGQTRDAVLATSRGHPCGGHPCPKWRLIASKPGWKTTPAKNPVQWACSSRLQSKTVHHSTKLASPSVMGVTRMVQR